MPARAWLGPALAAFLVAVALYARSIGYPFVRDDHDLIANDPLMRGDGGLARLLTRDFLAAAGAGGHLWRPWITLGFWLEGRIFGWNPAGFHAMNVLAHALASAGVAWLAARAGAPALAAALAGAWFAAMPAHVESVAWISGRTDVFCALFAILAFGLDRRAHARGRRHPGVWAPLAWALALASKEAALPLLAVFAAAAWIERREGERPLDLARWLAPYVAIAVVYLIAHEAWSAPLARAAQVGEGLAARIRWSGWTMLPHYAGMLWPGYPHAPDLALVLPRGPGAPLVVWGMVAAAASALGAAALVARRSRWAVPLLWFLAPLALTAAVALARAHLAFAERLVYLPSVGAAWVLALALAAARTRAPLVAGLAFALAAALVAWSAARTTALVPAWRDDRTMFEAITRTQPDNVRARIGYANQLAATGDPAAALAELDRAERVDPDVPELHASRAVVHYRFGRWPDVLASADRALALDPAMPQAALLKATALLRLRRLDEAEAMVADMRRRQPDHPAADGVWGQILLLRGDVARAVAPLERAVEWQPGDASLLYALGVASQMSGSDARAVDAFGRVVAIDPDYYEAWLRLAAVAHRVDDRATRDAALARARALPEAADGRAAALAAEWGVSP